MAPAHAPAAAPPRTNATNAQMDADDVALAVASVAWEA
jgi:hypothetical protein